ACGRHATGFDVDGNAIFAETDTGVDALDMTPYANNTPLGWGIETYWNEGDPVIDGGTPSLVDLLIYNAVPDVSDAIQVQPSGSEAGQVSAINAATGTPIAVINYTLNADIIVNANDGTLGDTDTLTLRGTDPANPGTSGLEDFTINLTAAGTPADPLVIVDDTFGGLLYRIQ